MILYLQLPFHFDTLSLQSEAHALQDRYWKLHYQTLHYEGNWKGLPLRSIGGKVDDIIISPHDQPVYEDTELLLQCPYMREVLSHFRCPLNAVRLLKLDAGARIKEHRDQELCFESGEIRLHIPVITHPAVAFYLKGERLSLREGECWYLNFNLLHRIENKSPLDRIHLVIDAVVNDWVTEVFHSKEIKVKKEAPPEAYDDETKHAIIERLRELNTDTAHRLADELEKDGRFSE